MLLPSSGASCPQEMLLLGEPSHSTHPTRDGRYPVPIQSRLPLAAEFPESHLSTMGRGARAEPSRASCPCLFLTVCFPPTRSAREEVKDVDVWLIIKPSDKDCGYTSQGSVKHECGHGTPYTIVRPYIQNSCWTRRLDQQQRIKTQCKSVISELCLVCFTSEKLAHV